MSIFGFTLWNTWTKEQRQTYNELCRLSDYELKDIGISRGMIRGIVEEMGQ